MKKKFFMLLAVISVLFSVSVFADGYDSYIVKLKDTGNIRLMSADNPNDEVLEPVVKEWSMYRVSAEDVDKLDMSLVEYVEPNYKIRLLDMTPNDIYYPVNQWNMPMINAPYAWGRGMTGEGVRVAVFDSGVKSSHPDLQNRVKLEMDYTETGKEPVSSHGTMVCGIVGAEMNNNIGVAGVSQADIYSFKIINTGKSNKADGTSDTLFRAMYDAIDKYDCKIMNLSLGFDKEDGSDFEAHEVKGFSDAIDEVYKKGAIVIAASGNSGDGNNAISYPAACGHVISVGAVGSDKSRAPYSTYNSMVDIAAPGGTSGQFKGICSTGFNESTGEAGYRAGTGTSFASPHVAAAAAIIKGVRPELTYEDLELLIKYSSEDIGDAGRDDYFGWGLLDIKEMLRLTLSEGALLKPSIPVYDKESKKLTIKYFNSSAEDSGDVSVCAAVYDDFMFKYITDIKPVTVPSFSEAEVVFDNINAVSKDKIKVFCFNDIQKIMPVSPAGKVTVE